MAFKFLGQRQLGKLPSRWVPTILMVAIEQNVFSPRPKWVIMTVILQKRGVLRMKGFSVCGLVLGITAAVCGVCAVVFSVLGLRRRR